MKRTVPVILLIAALLACGYALLQVSVDRNYVRLSMHQKWHLSRHALLAIEEGLENGKVEQVQNALVHFNSAASNANHHEFNNLLVELFVSVNNAATNDTGAANKTGGR